MTIFLLLSILFIAIYGIKIVDKLEVERPKPILKLPVERATERLSCIDDINEKHVYDAIKADLFFDIPTCAYGCTGERLIADLGMSAPKYKIFVIDNATIKGFKVLLLRYIPDNTDFHEFHEIKIYKDEYKK